MTFSSTIGQTPLEGGAWVSIDNKYTGELPKLVELGNSLCLGHFEGGPKTAIPITRTECLNLAQMFLTAALNSAWPDE